MAEAPVAAGSSGAQSESGAGAARANGQKIDVQVLAEKVYKLLLADARLGRARGTWLEASRRHGEG